MSRQPLKIAMIARLTAAAQVCVLGVASGACGGGLETSEPEVPLALDAPPEQRAFRASERRLKAFMSRSIEGDLADVPMQQRRLARRANKLKKEYKKIWGGGGGAVNVAALCRIGLIFDHFVRASLAGYRGAPIPTHVEQQGEAAVASHNERLSRLAQARLLPIVQRAGKWYRTCVEYSRKYYVSADYAREARSRMRSMTKIGFQIP